MLLLLSILTTPATWAYPSGLGVPVIGGGLSGPMEAGAPGLATNPAAARSSRPEFLIDVGLVNFEYGYTVAGEPEQTGDSLDPVPFLAAALPLGDFGIGLSLMVPYGRGGEGDPEGPFRYHKVRGSMIVGEADLSLAYAPEDWIRIGVGLRAAKALYSSYKKLDTGTTLYALLGEDANVPFGDPFLEGSREVIDASGTGTAFSVGLQLERNGFALGLGYRSPLVVDLGGDVILIPTEDLAIELLAQLAGTFTFPAELALGIRTPLGPVSLLGEVAWIDWSSASETPSTLKDLTVSSGDEELQLFLDLYGLSDPALLGSVESVGVSGYQDVVLGGLAVEVPIGEAWQARTGLWYYPGAIREDYVFPGNQDYNMWEWRNVVSRHLRDWGQVALTVDKMFAQDRVVENSVLHPTNDSDIAPNLPTSNGTYWLRMWRASLTTRVFF